jgi:large subunit ribosomal protein L25
VIIQAYRRDGRGTQAAKKLRRDDKIPAVVYARAEETSNLYLEEKPLLRTLEALRGKSPIVQLKIDEAEPFQCIIKSIQRNPINDQLLHIDFQKIHATERITVTVPIIFSGSAPGVKDGGIVDYHLREVPLRALADDIPAHLAVDISELKLGQSIHLADLKLKKVESLLALETPIVSVLVPKVVEEEKAAPVAEELKEPEVIAEKKTEARAAAEAEETKEGKEGKGKEGKEGKEKEGKESKK